MSNLLYGIIGGMGPITSSEFVSYIYSQCHGKFTSERDYPRIILISDSLAPDRLRSYKEDNFTTLKNYLENMIRKLNGFSVDNIFICCIVAHACLKNMPDSLKHNIISMIDLLNIELSTSKSKPLLLSTSMLYNMKLIDDVIYPNEQDSELMNRFIYKLKINADQKTFMDCIAFIENMLNQYHADSVVLACSDLHLVNRFIKKSKVSISFRVIDMMDLAVSYILK